MLPYGSRGAKLVQAALEKVNVEMQEPVVCTERNVIQFPTDTIDSCSAKSSSSSFENKAPVYQYEPDAEFMKTISSAFRNLKNVEHDDIIINNNIASDVYDGTSELLSTRDPTENDIQVYNIEGAKDPGAELNNLILNLDTENGEKECEILELLNTHNHSPMAVLGNSQEFKTPEENCIIISPVEEQPEPTEENNDQLIIFNKEQEVDENQDQLATNDKQTRKGKLQQTEKQSTKRVFGLPYLGCTRKGTEIIDKNVERKSRSLKIRCTHIAVEAKTARTFLCRLVSDETRDIIFKEFWKIKTWPEKKMYVKGLVGTRNILRRRKFLKNLKKKEGHDIFLPKADGIKVKVCRTFFINTLGIGEDTFKRWVKKDKPEKERNATENNDHLEIRSGSETEDEPATKRSKVQAADAEHTAASNRDLNLRKNNLQIFIDLLPKVPSHYCRSTSKKIYVESTFRSSKHMHEVYSNWCTGQQFKPLGISFFKKFLAAKNIAIHMPRKDQCDLCCSYKTKQVSEEDYQNHLKKKDEARAAKNKAKDSGNEKKLVLTMDLQSVLLCPKLLASKHYFKTKLQIHNFTIYVLNNKDVTLYVWNESNGGVTANEFTSCIIDFIASQQTYDHFVLISDGCGHQNRNRILSSALSDLSVKKNITIEQLYLEKGHTMMEADSVHATLEKYFKPPINSPADYYAQMRVARPSQPYNVHVVDFSFFKNFEELNTNLASLRPGRNRVGDPVVTDIRSLKYQPNGEIFYKINHPDEYMKLPQRKLLGDNIQIKQLYNKPIPIAESKYLHLQELKSAIEIDHHAFYDSLAFKKDEKKKEKATGAGISSKEKENLGGASSSYVKNKGLEKEKKNVPEKLKKNKKSSG